MPRPTVPNLPYGPRARRMTGEREEQALLSLVVPVASPQRELHALRALVKPHHWTREAVRHRLATDATRSAEQAWEEAWRAPLLVRAREAAGRVGVAVEWTELGGDAAHACLRFAPGTPAPLARAVAAACSAGFPTTWFALGRLYLRGGRFWRRERGYKLNLRPAGDVHLPRGARAALRDLLRVAPASSATAGGGASGKLPAP